MFLDSAAVELDYCALIATASPTCELRAHSEVKGGASGYYDITGFKGVAAPQL